MRVLSLLADGAWHSGAVLAETLGVSRAAVNKQVKKAREVGVVVHSVRGRGYRLQQPFQPLNNTALLEALSAHGRSSLEALDVLACVDSTNDYLHRTAGPGAARACFAEFQSGGRGRRGRHWISPYGVNLYFSVAWTYQQTPAALGALSLAVGIELAEVLRAHGADVRLKWPNDLYLQHKKLGGVLIEHRGELAGGSSIIAGVGINLGMGADQARAIDQPWTALGEHIQMPPRNQLAAQVLDAVLRALNTFSHSGFEGYRRRWRELDLSYEKPVTLDMGDSKIHGRATGVAADGALIVACGGHLKHFYAGELSLRVDP